MLRLTAADLLEALRGKDVYDPRDVAYAVIETNGSLSVARKPDKETPTLADLGLAVQQQKATLPFVVDGQVLTDNLTACGKNAAWLEQTAAAPPSAGGPDPGAVGQRHPGLFPAEKRKPSRGRWKGAAG